MFEQDDRPRNTPAEKNARLVTLLGNTWRIEAIRLIQRIEGPTAGWEASVGTAMSSANGQSLEQAKQFLDTNAANATKVVFVKTANGTWNVEVS